MTTPRSLCECLTTVAQVRDLDNDNDNDTTFLWMFDNSCTGARSGRVVRRQVCVAEEDVALLRPDHRQWQRVHDVKQNCTGVRSWNFHLKSWRVESNPGYKDWESGQGRPLWNWVLLLKFATQCTMCLSQRPYSLRVMRSPFCQQIELTSKTSLECPFTILQISGVLS